jgi:hypothetical protein
MRLSESLGSNRSQGWAVEAPQADTFRLMIVQDLDGGAVKDGDDGAGKSTHGPAARNPDLL